MTPVLSQSVARRHAPSWCAAFIMLLLVGADARGQPQQSQADSAIDALLSLTDLEGLSVSPDGEHIVFQTRRAAVDRNTYEIGWTLSTSSSIRVLFSVDNWQLREIAGGASSIGVLVQTPIWAPDSTKVAIVENTAQGASIVHIVDIGRHRTRAIRFDGATEELFWALNNQLFVRENLTTVRFRTEQRSEERSGFLFDDRWFPFASNRPTSASAEAQFRFWQITSAGRRREINQLEFAAIAPPQHTPAFYGAAAPALGPNGETTADTVPLESDRGGLVPRQQMRLTPPSDGGGLLCQDQRCIGEIEQVWWRDDASVLFLRREGRAHERFGLYAWTPNDNAVQTILETEDFLSDCQMRAERLACFFETPTKPRTLVAIDTTSGAIATLFDPNPTSDFAQYGSLQTLFADAGSDTALGRLLLPKQINQTPVPLVIVTYQCRGFLRGGTGDEYPMFAFAASGIASLCFDAPRFMELRRSVTSAGELVNRLKRDDFELRANRDALERMLGDLSAERLINRNRVAITGLSAGAETTHWSLINMPGLAAAIASGPGPEPTTYFLTSEALRRSYNAWGFTLPIGAGRQRWDRNSIVANTERVFTPLLINAADSEYLLAVPTFVALQERGRAVEMYVFPNEGHSKWQPQHRQALYRRNVRWLDFWLRGSDSPSPDESQRWHLLRDRQCALFEHRSDTASFPPNVPWYCE